MFLIQFHGKSFIILFLLLTVLGVSSCSSIPEYENARYPAHSAKPQSVPVYSYRIVNTYPHDNGAFTQGLVFENDVIYEGTGLYGKSSLRKLDLETGEVLQIYELPTHYFGEGITVFQDIIIQLTWKSNSGFIYDKNSFQLLRDFTYATEGWGITHDGERLIMSDGTSTLHFLDPETFSTIGHIEVYDNDIPIDKLNELEYINGQIYANVWQTNYIAIIDPQSGQVSGWVELSGLLPSQYCSTPVDVLNGIAYDNANDRLLVTGKLWPWLFEIKLVAKE
ncbi:MAG: glutaminyl-peptide cyclotransferase [Chloroflexi bacterium]|nr:glutaminyl-peptide cyclotransferase [Chloroflexota bacterium]